jgi:hypothetical protein
VLEASEPGKRKFVPFCSATLIGEKTLVTAAHCKAEANKDLLFQARCGALPQNSKNGEVPAFKETHAFSFKDIDANPKFDGVDKKGTDVAYIKLSKASELSPAIPVGPKSSIYNEIAKNPGNYECRVEGFGKSMTHLVRDALREDSEILDELSRLLGEDGKAELPVGTSYKILLDETDGKNAKKGDYLALKGSFEVDFDELKKSDPERYKAIVELNKAINLAIKEIKESTSSEEEKLEVIAALFTEVFPVGLMLLDHKKELYGQSLWGDSGGGKLCKQLATGKNFLVAVTSHIIMDGEESSEAPKASGPTQRVADMKLEVDEAPKGKERVGYGTKFSPLTYNPGIFDEQASMAVSKVSQSTGSTGK